MKSQDYRVALPIPVLGLLGIVFSGYVVLYGMGVIQWKLFSKVETFDLGDKATLFLHAFLFVGGGFLVALRRVKIDLTDSGIHYHGILRSRYIPWKDVTKVAGGGARNAVDLWSQSEHISLPGVFSRQDELRNVIFARAQTNAPNADIDETHGALRHWRRRKRKPESGDRKGEASRSERS